MDTGIHVLENVLTLEQCAALRACYERLSDISHDEDYNRITVVHYAHTEKDAAARLLMQEVSAIALGLVKRLFHVPREFVESIFVAKMPIGAHHIPHMDNARLDGTPNHTPQRTYSSLFYLNSDFEGGELVFPRHDRTIKPKTGMFVCFPSSPPYLHLVNSVADGVRWSAPVWFTNRLDAMMRF